MSAVGYVSAAGTSKKAGWSFRPNRPHLPIARSGKEATIG
jgi:hypothetical protein